jgi:hypothetical protein
MIEKVRSIAMMMSSLGRPWVGSCRAYIDATGERQARLTRRLPSVTVADLTTISPGLTLSEGRVLCLFTDGHLISKARRSASQDRDAPPAVMVTDGVASAEALVRR